MSECVWRKWKLRVGHWGPISNKYTGKPTRALLETVCIVPKLFYWNLNLIVMVFRGRSLEGEWDYYPYRRDPREIPTPSPMCDHNK